MGLNNVRHARYVEHPMLLSVGLTPAKTMFFSNGSQHGCRFRKLCICTDVWIFVQHFPGNIANKENPCEFINTILGSSYPADQGKSIGPSRTEIILKSCSKSGNCIAW